MRVVRFSTIDSLSPLANDWDRLSRGVPFRSWTWLSTWWRHYGPRAGDSRQRSLFVLGVFDSHSRLTAVAPWYLESTIHQGRVLRFLGDGEVCTDYLSVLCDPGREESTAEALADWLSEAGTPGDRQSPSTHSDRWDLLHSMGVDAQDLAVGSLIDRLADRGYSVHRQPGPRCWRIELPTSWDDYLAVLSSSHRKQLRQLERGLLAPGRLVLNAVQRMEELPGAQQILIDLHQRRWHQLGQPGCFSSQTFAAFHREVMPRLLLSGQLYLPWIELDGRPAAAEYQLIGNGILYTYQSGIDPELLSCSPGRLMHLMSIRRAIESGYRAVDFLRGDEPYKAHWRAQPRGSLDVRVVSSRAAAQLRHGVWLAGSRVRQWVKKGLKRGLGESERGKRKAESGKRDRCSSILLPET